MVGLTKTDPVIEEAQEFTPQFFKGWPDLEGRIEVEIDGEPIRRGEVRTGSGATALVKFLWENKYTQVTKPFKVWFDVYRQGPDGRLVREKLVTPSGVAVAVPVTGLRPFPPGMGQFVVCQVPMPAGTKERFEYRARLFVDSEDTIDELREDNNMDTFTWVYQLPDR